MEALAMLVLSRKTSERILIGDEIRVTIVRVSQNGVRVGIEAPSHLTVIREELKDSADQEASISQSIGPGKPR